MKKKTKFKHEYSKLYSTKAWRELRHNQLLIEPLCAMCKQDGFIKPAEVVDHVIPHKGNIDLFYDNKNLQSLCKYHHDSTKQILERTGKLIGGDQSGEPYDNNHHWNK